MPPDNHPIRIAFCITDLDPGGAERALVQLATRLDRDRWEPLVLCLGKPGPLVDVLEGAGIRVVCCGARRSTDVGALLRLYRALRRFRPQVLQTFLFHANIAGRIVGRLAGVRHCISGIRVAERRARWHLWLDRATNSLVRSNVCVSRAVAEFSATTGGLQRAKLVVIPNGVDVASIAAAEPLDLADLGIPPPSRVVVAVGRLDRQKGLQFLVDAAGEMSRGLDDVHFLIVGEGPDRTALLRRVSERGLSARVHFAGWRADVPRILRSATCLVLPSLWEGMPNVVLEAMAAGLPVVATRVEGVEELIVPGETGLLVPAASATELAEALKAVLRDAEQARRLGQAGQQRAIALFSWERMAARYDQLYQRIVDGPQP